MTILSIGEVLWDMLPSGPRLGGAPFNFAANCARLGHTALFLSAVGDDELGTRALEGIAAAGVSTEFVQHSAEAATGTVQVEFGNDGEPDYTIKRPAAYDFVQADAQVIAGLSARGPGLIYFGTLSELYDNNRQAVRAVIDAFPKAVKFYDVNLRRNSYDLELLSHLFPYAGVVKFNQGETEIIQKLFNTSQNSLASFCRAYAERYRWRGVCVTRGSAGCSVLLDGEFVEVPGFQVKGDHPVGAGDAFSAAFCHGIAQGWPAAKIADFANRVGAVVVSRPGGVGGWTVAECLALTRA